MTTSVGIYLRISEDRDGEQTATARQEEDCRKFAASQGWEVTDVYEDVDLSAYKRTVKRPEFERMLEAVREKAIDGVLAWKIDRITRRQRDFVRLDEQCEEAGGFIATVVDQIDTRQPTGRFVAELLVSQARMESENASIRAARKHEERAKRGEPQTGGTRAFGYSRDRAIIIEPEAALIRDAADRVLAGDGIRGICFEWAEKGVTSPAEKPWRPSSFKRMITSAALSGQREHRGVLSPGRWPAILTPEQTARLRAVLRDPARLKAPDNVRTYLLTGGLIRCGICDQRLVARPRDDGARRYVCARLPGGSNCGKIARLAEPVDEVVAEAVFLALDGADISEYMRREQQETDAGVFEAIRRDEEVLEELSRDYYAEKAITRAEFFAARDIVQARLEENRAQLARQHGRRVLTDVVGAGAEVRRRWPDAPLDWKRAVISAVIDYVVLEPAVKGRNTFDPSLVRPVWKY